jgi:hypothetical protein
MYQLTPMFACIVAMLFTSMAVKSPAAPASFPPGVFMRLQNDAIFVGEAPILEVTVVAPKENPIDVAAVMLRGQPVGLSGYTTDPQGRRFGPYYGWAIDPAGGQPAGAGLARLEPGQSVRFTVAIGTTTQPGEYTVNMTFRLWDPDRNPLRVGLVSYHFESRCSARPLADGLIVERLPLAIPESVVGDMYRKDKTEFIKVRTDDGAVTLFLRVASEPFNGAGAELHLRRLSVLPPEARLRAQMLLDKTGTTPVGFRLWIQTEGGRRRLELGNGGVILEEADGE